MIDGLKFMNRKYSIDIINSILKNRNIKITSDVYTKMNKHHEWYCLKCKYTWKASPSNVLHKKTGCPKCAGNARLTMEKIHEVAKSRGGQCLSEKYVNTTTKLEWKCRDGHIWMAAPGGVVRGSWCSICKSSLVEEKCRFVFESLTGKKFTKSRQALGNGWELDGFCKQLS